MERMGRILGAEIVKTAERITTFQEEVDFKVKYEEFKLPVRNLPSQNEATQIHEQVRRELKRPTTHRKKSTNNSKTESRNQKQNF